jgi:DNA-3-methyladenine glycosylase II
MTHHLTVPLPGPLDPSISLELFRRHGDDLLDRWDGESLIRTLPRRNSIVPFVCTFGGTRDEPVVHATIETATDAESVRAAVLSTFVAAPADFFDICSRDSVLVELDARFPGLRPVRSFDLLSALVRAISAQQVNLRWATTTRRRLAETFGRKHNVGEHIVYSLDATRLAAAAVTEIRDLQFTTRKSEYIISTAEAACRGFLDAEVLAQLPDDDVIARLTSLRGIGYWTAEWILARFLGRPRVVAGDLGVRKAVGRAYLSQPLPSEQAVRQATLHWGAAAGVAQALLLHGLSEQVLTPGAHPPTSA